MPTLYTIDSQLPSFYVRGYAQTVTMPVYTEGTSPTPPDSGTFNLYDQNKALVKTSAITVTGGIASVDVSALDLPATLSLSYQWQEEWLLVFSAGTEIFRRDAYLCLRALHPVVNDVLLTRRVKDLHSLLAAGQTNFSEYTQEAWGVINRMILQRGMRPYLIMNDYAFADCHIALTLELIFRDCSTYMGEGRYATRADDYQKEFVRRWDDLKWEYDSAESNQRADAERSVPARPLTCFNFAPRSWALRTSARRIA